ncbi:Lysine-specific demethylase JMJ25 [Bienertia sinuspersici]
MNSYHEIDTIKMEKQKAMQRYMTFKKIANIARTVEIVVAITFISCSISFTSSYFPAFIEISGAFLRRISSLLFSPHFVFLVGNIIIITLFAKSSSEKNSSENSGDEISEFVADNSGDEIPGEKPSSDNVREEIRDEVVKSTVEKEPEMKVYRRTKSTVEMPVVKKELRRSETEVRRKSVDGEKSQVKMKRKENRKFEEDELSNEEFRKKVEEFIEKQQRFLREEKLAVIVSN